MSTIQASFFDGETAVEQRVSVTLTTYALEIEGPQVAKRWWPLGRLIVITSLKGGLPLRLSHETERGSRLVIAEEAFARELAGIAPEVGGAINFRRVRRAALIIAIALLLTGGLLYGVLTLAPQQLAFLIPDSLREKLGEQIEKSFTADAALCARSGSSPEVTALEERIKQGNADLPPFTISVFDLPIVNAFALPGGRIVVTRGLIEAADTPDQVAGVVAHEIGHVGHRHPEAQLIRATGLQVLLALFTGGSGGDTIGGLAGTLTILRYSRDAEREADAHGLAVLTKAQIDPLGLKRFFEARLKEEGKDPGGPFGNLTSLLATHPLTEERIASIEPLPPGVARAVMTDADWAKLKKICASQ